MRKTNSFYLTQQELKEIYDALKITKKTLFWGLGLFTAFMLAVALWFAFTPINIFYEGTRVFITVLLLTWSVPYFVRNKVFKKQTRWNKTPWILPLALCAVFVATNFVAGIVTSPLFMDNRYRNRISVVESHSFIEDVEDYTTMQIPVVDKYLAEKLGDKKLGEDNLGSQYNVGEYYMICHENNLYWIAPIEFNGFFPWLSQKTSPGYVIINANDPADVEIVKSELRYTNTAYFFDYLSRHNYFSNLTAWRAEDAHLELTDEGEPRFVETVYTNRIGYTNGRDVLGVIVTNPKTGECEYYDYLNAPTWINHVLTEEVIIEQLNDWGRYVNGFWNAVFAKHEVLEVSTGINYVYSNGNMYLQTGMTSIGGDESIVGVMMVDMRTKEAFFYRIGGATEYAAAQSAIGKDQEKRYTATDPIMINCNGTPTYFLMLKDNEGLVKRYAYVNVKDYRLVTTAETKEQALMEYKRLIGDNQETPMERYEIAKIVPVALNGNTTYYIQFKGTEGTATGFENQVFRAELSLNPYLPFLQVGDRVEIRYDKNGDVYEISALNVVG